MMRVLLVNPYYPISETPSPPLGIAYLAGALEAEKVVVRVLDYVVFAYSKEKLEQEMEAFCPDLMGVTSVTMNFNHAMQVVMDAKAIDPALVTVMGGPHVTFLSEQLLSCYSALDIIVRGEGEVTLVELVREAKKGRQWHKVRGITYRDKTGITITPDRPKVNMDVLPLPARHLLPLGRYRALGMPISLTTSRGCPFSCIFCAGPKMMGRQVRYRRPKPVVDEMQALSTLGFHQVNLADDLFTANKNHCLSICREIRNRSLTPVWTAFSRVDTVSSEMLLAMKEAGCQAVSFGVESGNPEMLRRIKKGITREQVIKAVDMCRHAGIEAQASFILGLPGETPETLQQTVLFSETLKEMGVLFGYHLLVPFPGTRIYERREEYDLTILSQDWDQYHANRAVVETATVCKKKMDAVVMAWEENFLQRLKEIEEEREAGKAGKADAWMLTKLEHTVLIYEWMMSRCIEEKGGGVMSPRQPTPMQAMDTLAVRIAGKYGPGREKVLRTLKYAYDGDHLYYTIKGDKITWTWRNYL